MTPVAAAEWSSASLRCIIDNLKQVVFQTDAQGLWTFLNPAWEEITGFSVAETLGKLFLDYVHPEDREQNQRKFRPLIERQKEFCRHSVRYLTRDGGFRWIEVHARLTLDEAGAIIGTSGTLADITEQFRSNQELCEARRRLEFVLASNPAVIYAARPGHNGTPWETTFISENTAAILGAPAEKFLADPEFWYSTIHPDDLPALSQAFQEMAVRGRTSLRFRSRDAHGDYRWMRNDSLLLTDSSGRAIETIGCLVDESHTRSIEESLRTHAAILEAVGTAAHRFLDAQSWRVEIDGVLRCLGVAARASRVYVYQNIPVPGGDLLATLRHGWNDDGIPGHTPDPHPAISYRERGLARWIELLGRGEPIHGPVSAFPAAEREDLTRRQIRSLLAVPIFSGPDWWGFIGFDDCTAGREWSTAEIEALRAAAGIFGAAIHREQTQSALRYNEALLRTMTDASPLGYYIVDDRSDRILYCNDRFCEIWGVQHLAGQIRQGLLTNHDLIPNCAALIADVPAFAASCEPLQDEANRSVVKDLIAFHDGRTIQRFSTQVRDADDAYFGRLYLFEDVTEQKRTEDELLRSHSELEARVAERTVDLEELNHRLLAEIAERRAAQQALADREAHFRTLIENSSDVIFVADASATLEYVSPSAERTFGYPWHELIGKKGFDFILPADAPKVMLSFQQGLNIPGSHTPLEFQIRHCDGSLLQVEAIGNNQLANPAVRGVVVTLRDITDRRRLEDQFRQAQKMEAVGRLAGGVAHDFNNLLTVICGYGELLAKRLPPGSPLLRNVGQIRRAGDRATALVQQLLAFSRKQVVQPSVLNLNDAIADLEKMLRRLIGEDIELAIAPCSHPVYVNIDRTQLDQVVMNLSVNARDAMPSGGSLTISGGLHAPRNTADCRDCRISRGDFAVLAVRDTGCGMTSETRAHIFEPFFTTKEVGKGTGLGLSMVYGAVQQAGGHICLETAPGKGSEFRICLPRVPEPAPIRDESCRPILPGGKETVLLVEDEELVRTLLSETLSEAGYHVIEACHGEHALDLLQKRNTPVDLPVVDIMVTDMVMPRMSGRELATRLALLQPRAKVLFVSGYPRQELEPGCRFLKKPFTPEDLVREVRMLLDEVPAMLAR